MKEKNDSAMAIAKVINHGGCHDTLHIYTNGLVMQLECDADRHLALRSTLLKGCGIMEEARAGRCSVWILPFKVEGKVDARKLPPVAVLATKGWHDHREDDYHTIDSTVELFQMSLSGV